MDKVKLLRSHFTRHRCFPVKFVKSLRVPLKTRTILLNICEIDDYFFMAVKFIYYCTIFKRKYESKKKVSNLNLFDTCATLIHVSRTKEEMNKILQFSLELADTVGPKKIKVKKVFANMRCPLFRTFWKITFTLDNLLLLYLYLR